jgi:hypothetical protein
LRSEWRFVIALGPAGGPLISLMSTTSAVEPQAILH